MYFNIFMNYLNECSLSQFFIHMSSIFDIDQIFLFASRVNVGLFNQSQAFGHASVMIKSIVHYQSDWIHECGKPPLVEK